MSRIVMGTSLDESYRCCEQLARSTGKNFYYAFLTLPQREFRAMCALYAFLRTTDDLGDAPGIDPSERSRRLRDWRSEFEAALLGVEPPSPILPALVDVVRGFAVPPQYLRDVLAGVEMDLGPVAIETFAELERYCYHVAGAVGLSCIHIWGFHDARAPTAAIDCGLAFQLTNILRDVREDARMQRVYLPREDCLRFGVEPADLADRADLARDPAFLQLMAFEAERARAYYARARQLFEYLAPASRPILDAMLRIYGGLLHQIERKHYDVLSKRIGLSPWRKLSIVAGVLARHKLARLRGGA